MKLAGSRKTWRRFVVAGLLTVHASLLAYSAAVHSPTLNEPGHLVAGISYWQFGRFDVYKVNPPLSRLVAALPVLAAGCKTDWTNYYDGPGARPEMALGEAFVHANGERSIWLFTIARWACIPFSLIGGYVVFRWSCELYGAAAGILSLALWCFCPNILAHGSLITPDMSATAIGVAACYLFWHWLRRPTWWQTILCGAVLGIAELAKTTLLLFYFIWPVIWLLYRLPDWRRMRGRDWLRELGMLAACAILSVYVLNLGYGFEGTFTPLGKYRFVSDSLSGNSTGDRGPEASGNRFANSWLAAIPVPLPKNYVEGIDLQKRDFEHYDEKSYLNGVWADHGWWYYYLEALALKVPLGTWLLLLLAATRRLWCGNIFLPLPVAGEGVRQAQPSGRGEGAGRGLAHFAMPSEQNVPVPLSPEFPAGEDARTTNVPLPLPAAGEGVRQAQPSGRGEGAGRGLAHFPMPCEENVPVPLPPEFPAGEDARTTNAAAIPLPLPAAGEGVRQAQPSGRSEGAGRGLAHFAMPSEQNVPVPLSPEFPAGEDARTTNVPLPLPAAGEGVRQAQPSGRGEGAGRGLAHFPMPCEENVPVPLPPALAPEFPAGEDARTTNVAVPVPFHPTPATWRDEFTLLFPALAILTFVSSQTGFNEHMRYVLPIFPFFFIWIGRVAVAFASRQRSRGLAHFAMPGEQNVPVPFCPSILIGRAALALASHKRIPQIFVAAALAWSIGSSLWIYPHSLSYFNEIAGGPLGGPNYLLGSNVDWGQDLLFLKHWLAKHPDAQPLKLAYFGPDDPSAFGIKYTAPGEFARGGNGLKTTSIPSGSYAISVSLVEGMAHSSFKGDGTEISFRQNAFARFRRIRPTAAAAYSIYVYQIVKPEPVGHEPPGK